MEAGHVMSTQGQAAAQWWATALRSPRQDNGDALQSFLLAAVSSWKNPPSATSLAAFASSLADIIDNKLAAGTKWLSIGVDYGPDPELAEAMTSAGVNPRDVAWPCKTRTSIAAGKYVTAAAGYGASEVQIWPRVDRLGGVMADTRSPAQRGADTRYRREQERWAGVIAARDAELAALSNAELLERLAAIKRTHRLDSSQTRFGVEWPISTLLEVIARWDDL
jgi:hypothetical protein